MTITILPPQQLSPVELLVLQGTSFCNLNCKYCDLSEQSRRTKTVMGKDLIERLFSQLFQSAHLGPELTVVWHSGEPLTLPPSYYDEAIALILRLRDEFAPGRVDVSFDIQTNGVLIDAGWCDFLVRHRSHLALGVSCDGPADLHDLYRLNWNGRTSHAQTLRGMELLQQHGLKYKIIAVVTRPTLSRVEAFYAFFHARREHLTGFHFNILADGRAPDPGLAYSTQDRQAYQAFYRRLLELDRQTAARGEAFGILNFSQAMARILRADTTQAGPVHEASAPLKCLNVDAQGNVTTFYAGLSIDVLRHEYGDGEGLCLGNIHRTPLAELARSPKLHRILRDFATSARACKAGCDYFGVCSGGFEITKRTALGSFEATETQECVIHVKALVDALLEDVEQQVGVSAAAA